MTDIPTWADVYPRPDTSAAANDEAQRAAFHAYLEQQKQPGFVPKGYEQWIAEGQDRLKHLQERKA